MISSNLLSCRFQRNRNICVDMIHHVSKFTLVYTTHDKENTECIFHNNYQKYHGFTNCKIVIIKIVWDQLLTSAEVLLWNAVCTMFVHEPFAWRIWLSFQQTFDYLPGYLQKCINDFYKKIVPLVVKISMSSKDLIFNLIKCCSS